MADTARRSGLLSPAARLGLTAVLAVAAAALCSSGHASVADERTLAERFAPVVRLVSQQKECGHDEPYLPMNVDALFDEPTVALRGPWTADDLVKIAPVAKDPDGARRHHDGVRLLRPEGRARARRAAAAP